MARVSPGPAPIPVGGQSNKIADVDYTRFRNGRLNANVLRKLANRAQVYKNFKGSQRLTVGGINDPMASFMPSAFSK